MRTLGFCEQLVHGLLFYLCCPKATRVGCYVKALSENSLLVCCPLPHPLPDPTSQSETRVISSTACLICPEDRTGGYQGEMEYALG